MAAQKYIIIIIGIHFFKILEYKRRQIPRDKEDENKRIKSKDFNERSFIKAECLISNSSLLCMNESLEIKNSSGESNLHNF